tara:strand:- start:473 stop:784 length:312 start_codon:yes stop_codon:yes gene_type:complete
MNVTKTLAPALKWKHPNAYSHVRNGVLLEWSDPDGAAQPDEATIIAEYEASGASAARKVVVDAKEAIRILEDSITPRRVREALTDPTWVAAVEAKIKLERAKL